MSEEISPARDSGDAHLLVHPSRDVPMRRWAWAGLFRGVADAGFALLAVGWCCEGSLHWFALRLAPLVLTCSCLLRTSHWSLGRDGIRVASAKRPRGRFFPFRAIESITATGAEDTRLLLQSGSDIRFPRVVNARAHALVDLANEIAKGTTEAGIPSNGRVAFYEPDIRMRIERLRDLGRFSEGFRTASVPREELWAIIEDFRSWPIDRAAAAIALGKLRSVGEEERLSRAARATLAPGLSVLFRLIVQDADVGRLEPAVRRVEELNLQWCTTDDSRLMRSLEKPRREIVA